MGTEIVAHRRMLIEDFDLMIEARRSYLAVLDGRVQKGETLSEEQARDQGALVADKRLEEPLFMEWELRGVVDDALGRALAQLYERVPEQASLKAVPEEHLAAYIEGKREAIGRCRARLAGELGD